MQGVRTSPINSSTAKLLRGGESRKKYLVPGPIQLCKVRCFLSKRIDHPGDCSSRVGGVLVELSRLSGRPKSSEYLRFPCFLCVLPVESFSGSRPVIKISRASPSL